MYKRQLQHGLPAVLSQTFRTLVHSRLEVGMASYAGRYPGTDVVLFEPAREAVEMFFANPFSLAARREICALAYRSTREDLRRRSAELEPVLARHGVRFRWSVLGEEPRAVHTGLHRAARGDPGDRGEGVGARGRNDDRRARR